MTRKTTLKQCILFTVTTKGQKTSRHGYRGRFMLLTGFFGTWPLAGTHFKKQERNLILNHLKLGVIGKDNAAITRSSGELRGYEIGFMPVN